MGVRDRQCPRKFPFNEALGVAVTNLGGNTCLCLFHRRDKLYFHSFNSRYCAANPCFCVWKRSIVKAFKPNYKYTRTVQPEIYHFKFQTPSESDFYSTLINQCLCLLLTHILTLVHIILKRIICAVSAQLMKVQRSICVQFYVWKSLKHAIGYEQNFKRHKQKINSNVSMCVFNPIACNVVC